MVEVKSNQSPIIPSLFHVSNIMMANVINDDISQTTTMELSEHLKYILALLTAVIMINSFLVILLCRLKRKHADGHSISRLDGIRNASSASFSALNCVLCHSLCRTIKTGDLSGSKNLKESHTKRTDSLVIQSPLGDTFLSPNTHCHPEALSTCLPMDHPHGTPLAAVAEIGWNLWNSSTSEHAGKQSGDSTWSKLDALSEADRRSKAGRRADGKHKCLRTKRARTTMRRSNGNLFRKYRRYVRKVRLLPFCSDPRQISLMEQSNSHSHNVVATEDSPWVRACDIHENRSCISGRTNSSQSSFRTTDVPFISPKAHDSDNIIADLFIVSNRIQMKQSVMKGTFGQLSEATMRVPCDRHRIRKEVWKKAYVKSVSDVATEEQVRLFLRDACKLAGLQHKYLATVIATTQSYDTRMRLEREIIEKGDAFESDGGGGGGGGVRYPWLIYPHADLGNLKQFLRSTACHDSMAKESLTADRLLQMSVNLVQAVQYLHNKQIIHEDIATRNCLLGAGFRVRLSDSALSRDLFPDDYHCLGDNTNRPIKWLALEAMIERKYTKATDVWAVGVTLWEMLTRGQQPYEMFDAFEMLHVLRAGFRILQPCNCPDELSFSEAPQYAAAKDFRNRQSRDRPTHREPPGFVKSERWMIQRPPDSRIQSKIFENIPRTPVSDTEAAYLMSEINAKVSGTPVTDDFSYQVVDNISSIPLVDHRLHDNLCFMGFEQLTPVQRHAIGIMSVDEQIKVSTESADAERVVGKYDLMAAAQTGSGKTLAYLIPILNRLLRVYPFESMQDKLTRSPCQFPSGLVMVPTRELAQQIVNEAMKLCYRTFLRPVTLYGGERPSKQLYELSLGSHLVVATPGRLLDFLRQGALRLNHCRALVLDEADRMLDMGFEEQIREIIESREFGMPLSAESERQTCLFSATFPREVAVLARTFLRGSRCVSLTIGDSEVGTVVPEWGKSPSRSSGTGNRQKDELNRLTRIVPREIRQRIEYIEDGSIDMLYSHLANIIQKFTDDAISATPDNPASPSDAVQRVLVFCNTKSEVDQIDAALYRSGFKSAAIHGDKSQIHRSKALEYFKRGRAQVLVASSVAARGLDIPHVAAVINIGFPKEVEDYVHRIGRTGRMGRSGEAITLLSPGLLNKSSRAVAYGVLQLVQTTSSPDEQSPAVPDIVRRFARSGDPDPKPQQYRGSRGGFRNKSFDQEGRGDRYQGGYSGGKGRSDRSRPRDELSRRFD